MPTSDELRLETYIQTLRNDRRLIEAETVLSHNIDTLWPLISNTDQVNAMAKLAPVIISTRPLDIGGSEISVETRDLGMRLYYEELPYEWEKPHWLRVERIYSKGPTRYVSFEVQVKALETGQTHVRIIIGLVPKIPLILVKPKLNGIAKRIIEAYKVIDQRLHENTHRSIAAFLADAQKNADAISTLETYWTSKQVEPELARSIARYVYTAPDTLLGQMRPFEIANLYHLDKMETLKFFLQRAKDGDFHMSWDLLCPSCKGAKNSASTLAEIDPNVHCDSCGIDYSSRFDDNFELTFYPSSAIREFTRATFCAGSPANTAHIAYQQNIFPNQTRVLPMALKPGQYRFRTLKARGELNFEVLKSGGLSEFTLTLTDEITPLQNLQLASQCQLTLVNPREVFQTLKVDDLGWKQDRVTAAQVTSLQAFRDLFNLEVLRPGVNVELTNLNFMFTDLKDSTQMYEERGDAAAFALVQAHFEIMLELIAEYEGAIVKTIGDAVMAVFNSPLTALKCAIVVQREFRQWNEEWNKNREDLRIIIKMGLHKGPCIALNLNDRLDYFGSTINKAARVQGQSVGEDVVISKEFLELAHIKDELDKEALELESFEANLKGIEGQTPLYRFYP